MFSISQRQKSLLELHLFIVCKTSNALILAQSKLSCLVKDLSFRVSGSVHIRIELNLYLSIIATSCPYGGCPLKATHFCGICRRQCHYEFNMVF